jgi:hypothetical protein
VLAVAKICKHRSLYRGLCSTLLCQHPLPFHQLQQMDRLLSGQTQQCVHLHVARTSLVQENITRQVLTVGLACSSCCEHALRECTSFVAFSHGQRFSCWPGHSVPLRVCSPPGLGSSHLLAQLEPWQEQGRPGAGLTHKVPRRWQPGNQGPRLI